MTPSIIGPASYKLFGFFPTWILAFVLPVIGIGLFTYIMARRIAPLIRANPDNRFDQIGLRVKNLIIVWLGQVRQPRYMLAGVLHILIFAGFLILSIRSTSLVIIGFSDGFVLPGFGGVLGDVYNFIKDYAATFVLIACIIAAVRRGIFKPKRYAVPEKYGKDHTAEAVFVLGVISTLMISESLFEASELAYEAANGAAEHFLAPLSLVWIFKKLLSAAPLNVLQGLHIFTYFVHDLAFFFFLNFLPMGKHFHVITSIFNVFFMRVKKGNIKPVKYGISDEQLDDLETFGVKKLEDFTWKHMLDFYSCADCGRCSDQCPANAVGRPLSPRFITIKARDLIFKNYPMSGKIFKSKLLVEDIYTEDEIWSCTTCGACEEECPLGIEYIDKIVDLRRGMVDEGLVPQTLQKPLKALEKRGNPYGKMEKKRAEWAESKEFQEICQVKDLSEDGEADTLYFVDSITSYDDNMQDIARRTAVILDKAGVDFGILGKLEKDSGNEVLRFGEEMLYQDLKSQNTEAILETGVKQIVTADPHAFNALKNDYKGLPPVKHISQVVAEKIESGALSLKSCQTADKVYVYHDPCYLGRHNGVYEAPRKAMDAINGLTRVELEKSRDRSFCCGGGGLMLFYEPEEETRMGVLRVNMAAEAGANVIVTACPFCLVNIQDAIKVAGKEGEMEALDFTALIEQHLE
ncbi:MAG: (Fe-S)-binding protein [Proteobacteria bacterium]|nr:(Fe-S)-binding protein [Pseudomonadota bacterium]MBU1387370.1 (Fe-S)-binding protein [Pseudomonadota bacterium]MBU1541655.1 (Fe-S)-binding protein [Pseudomonadota bacterium]MBU2430648.1 (Fe-S)-binding protein [Pseudomonadota bacterium]MBU2482121.1 (Fe-S)-binding protein [Pseudomonadota bacterium]